MTKTVTRLVGFVLFATAFTPFAKADEWDKKTIITTHEPIRIEGQVLAPGQYVMKLLDSPDRHIVEIYDVNKVKLEMTILALPAYRLDSTGKTRLSFYETPNGQAPALRTWFYPGDNSGLEFSVKR